MIGPQFPQRAAILAMIQSGVAPHAEMNRGLNKCNGDREFGWVFPSAEAIDLIARRMRPACVLVELGAGTAVWSATIAKALAPLKVYATDIRPMNWLRNWHEIDAYDAQTAMTKYPDADLLSVYPYQFIVDVLCKMRPGQRIFWCGPTENGKPQHFPDGFSSMVCEIDQAPYELAPGRYSGKLVVFERR